jgi:hypothetical protein
MTKHYQPPIAADYQQRIEHDLSRADDRHITDHAPGAAGIVRSTHRPTNFVAPAQTPLAYPVQSPANGALGELVAGMMAAANTTHYADPETRGRAMLWKTLALGSFLSVATIAAMVVFEAWAFFAWLLLASLEFVGCFLFLAVLDWREHPSAIRWQWTQGLLALMENEQEARLRAQYGEPEPPTVQQESVIGRLVLLVGALLFMLIIAFSLLGELLV